MDAVSQFVPGIGLFFPSSDLPRRKRRRPPDVQQPRERKFEEFSSVKTEVSMEAPRSNQQQQWMSFVCCSSHGRETLGNGSSFLENNGNCHIVLGLLKDCTNRKDLYRGSRLHDDIIQRGLLEKDVYIGSALVNMYVKCGSLAKAQNVFEKLPVQNVVSWNALISGYVQHGYAGKALYCFEKMQNDGISPSEVTFVCTLKACGDLKAIDKGQEIHARILMEGLLEKNDMVCTALIDMYAKCGSFAKAQGVLEKLTCPHVSSWNALISGYNQHGHCDETLICFQEMQQKGISPNGITFTCILKACGVTGSADKGLDIYAKLLREKWIEKDILIGTALVDMFVKCSQLAKAMEVFDKLPFHDVVSWTTLIGGHAQHDCSEDALNFFRKMQNEGIMPNSVTYIAVLKACGSMGAIGKGREIHAMVLSEGLLGKDILVGTVLVDMYGKCGDVAQVRELFNELPLRDTVLWNVLIATYEQHGYDKEAITSFEQMRNEGFSPNAVTYACILKACGSIREIDKGQDLHFEIDCDGFLGDNVLVGNALVQMYAKCGLLVKAQEVFDGLKVRNTMVWNQLLTGYSQFGEDNMVLDLFNKMIREKANPDDVTFMIVLNICSLSGLLDKGQMYFEMMNTVYGITPTMQHYTCMVNLFSRVGHFDKVINFIKEMTIPADLAVWHTVLDACQKWRNLKLGKWAFENAIRLNEKDDPAYICMSNIYADLGMQEEANKIEVMRLENKA